MTVVSVRRWLFTQDVEKAKLRWNGQAKEKCEADVCSNMISHGGDFQAADCCLLSFFMLILLPFDL